MADLRTELVGILDDVVGELTTSGVNFAAREPVYREIHAYEAGATSFRRGTHTLENPDDPALTVMDLFIGQVPSWESGTREIVGDARMQIPQTLTRDQVLGKGLAKGQELLYRIGTRTLDETTGLPSGGEVYRIENGGVKDPDGLTWILTLKRAAQ